MSMQTKIYFRNEIAIVIIVCIFDKKQFDLDLKTKRVRAIF